MPEKKYHAILTLGVRNRIKNSEIGSKYVKFAIVHNIIDKEQIYFSQPLFFM